MNGILVTGGAGFLGAAFAARARAAGHAVRTADLLDAADVRLDASALVPGGPPRFVVTAEAME